MRGHEFFIEVARRPPFTKLHPRVAAFFKDYLAREKVVRFDGRFVVNTHFPPYPSRAFDRLAEGFARLGDATQRRLYSVTIAVTNRCPFDCWHCYNAGRDQVDPPLDAFRRLVVALADLGAVMITLTGGEPLGRPDLEDIARLFDDRFCVIIGTTGAGLTADRARRLREAGVFGVGISLDALDEAEHDRLRGRKGAFASARDALRVAGESGLYPYVVSVATGSFLEPRHFESFLHFAGQCGAREVHLLEPSATGKLAGRTDLLLSVEQRRQILNFQQRVAADDDMPILSSYAYLESPEAFGCGAGLTHLYIDGSGEVCPCQLVPLSFGNITCEPLAGILDRMAHHFRTPRATCVGRLLANHIAAEHWPTPPDVSEDVCRRCLPPTPARPRFFETLSQAQAEVGRAELRAVYDEVHADYDKFWLGQAGRPIVELIDTLTWRGDERVFEAGCGTGFATTCLAERAGRVLAVDISENMLAHARQRLGPWDGGRVELVVGDALEVLAARGSFDLVFSSWVLGYIPLKSFFSVANAALARGGRLAFIVHKENSPREPLEIFAELVARDPTVLAKRVAFDFPRDADHVRAEITAAGLEVKQLWEGQVVFRFDHPEGLLEHLLRSGAGTAFYDAVDPGRRADLRQDFLHRAADRCRSENGYEVRHEYVACISAKRQGSPRQSDVQTATA